LLNAANPRVQDARRGIPLFKLDERCRDRAGMHHRYVRPPLVEAKLIAVIARVFTHESKQPEIAFRVTGTKFIVTQVPEANIAMVVLHAFPK
jgi:hypothetical protein